MSFDRVFHAIRADLSWTLSLFGAAVGAGILFLPVRAGLSGFWVTLILAVPMVPIIYCSHKLFASMAFHTEEPCDYTCAVEELINPRIGAVTSVLFAGLLLVLLMAYTTALNNSLGELLVVQGAVDADPARGPWLSLGFLAVFFCLLGFGGSRVVGVLGALSGLLIVLLLATSLLMADLWHFGKVLSPPSGATMKKDALLLFPILVQSFIFFPALSSMVMVFRREQAGAAEGWRRTVRVIRNATLLLVCFTMFFVFSCLFALDPNQLGQAASMNLSALDILGRSGSPLLGDVGQFVSILALTTSFFGIFLGYRESGKRLLALEGRRREEGIFLGLTFLVLWGVAVLDVSVIAILGEAGGPLSALFLFIIPAWAHIRQPGHLGEKRWLLAFVLSVGAVQMCAYFLGSL